MRAHLCVKNARIERITTKIIASLTRAQISNCLHYSLRNGQAPLVHKKCRILVEEGLAPFCDDFQLIVMFNIVITVFEQ